MTKKIWLIVLPLTIFGILSWMTKAKKKHAAKFLVTGSIMQTASYCQGARPTKEMLDKLRTPAGIAFGKLFLKKSIKNEEEATIINTIQADENGNFSIYLLPGKYCIIEEWKSKSFTLPLTNKYQTVDASCYRKLYDACDYQIEVTDKNLNGLRLIFHRPCYYNLPCISYKGPLPHSIKKPEPR